VATVKLTSEAKPVPESPRKVEAARITDDHRAMATVLVKAPGLLKSIRSTLDGVAGGVAPGDAVKSVLGDVEALSACLSPVAGHPVQCIVAAIDALVHESGITFGSGTVRTLDQALDLAGGLLDPRHLKRAKDLSAPRALVVDDDRDLLATVDAALGLVDIHATQSTDPVEALNKLCASSFDLVLLDIGLPG